MRPVDGKGINRAVQVCFVAGVGFFTDAVDVFALNTVITIFRQLYPATGQADDILPQDWDVILLTATLGGICIGMFVFGILGWSSPSARNGPVGD